VPLSEDLISYVNDTFQAQWKTRGGQVVPVPDDLRLSNDAVEFDRATVLYADLSGSTTMVDSKNWSFSGEVYKAFLYCAARLITDNGGSITAYDGDRVMGVFIGESQSTNAAICALKINYATKSIIMPSLKAQYKTTDFTLRHVVGIDTSELRVARTGVRGGNDLVWIGRAANYAAKLSDINMKHSTWITGHLFNRLEEKAKFGGKDKSLMWDKHTWTTMAGLDIYGSTWWWKV
jgi:class 3 adenylate cyclase